MTTCVCVASGPSLTVEQCEQVAAAQSAGKCHVLVVNDNWRRLPNADVLYAADGKWWNRYWPEIESGFHGECWTQDADAAKRYGLCFMRSQGKPGLSRDPTVIHGGQNSGYQAIGLVYHFGARKIILVGYDMMREGGKKNGKAHWFGNHPQGFGNAIHPQSWAPHYVRLGADLQSEGVTIVNCTITTALQWPRADLAATLTAL